MVRSSTDHYHCLKKKKRSSTDGRAEEASEQKVGRRHEAKKTEEFTVHGRGPWIGGSASRRQRISARCWLDGGKRLKLSRNK